LTHPKRFIIAWKRRLSTAGAKKYNRRISVRRTLLSIVPAIESQQPIGPTKPAVPIPAPAGELVILKTIVEIGPSTAAARVGASHIIGLRAILPICSIDVPKP
jgi:hypothetical protein